MPLRVKLVSALAMMLLMIGVLIVGIFAAQTQTITMEGSVNFEISDKTLYIQDVRVQMDNNNEPYSLKEQGEFLPGYINGNFSMNLGSLDNTYGSFAIYFDIVNLMVDGQTAVYNAKATTTQEGVTLEPSGEILGAELSADTATADELNNPANLSGTIKLLVTATSVPTVYLNQITLTINEAERLQSGFVFSPLTENTVELSEYNGSERDIVIPESYSVGYNSFTSFTFDPSALDSEITYIASLIYGTWHYTDNNNNTGALNYFAMDGSVDLSSLAMPLQVDVDYIVNIPADNANSIEYFLMYLQMLVHMRDQYGMINGGVYATFNGYERKLYTIEELNSFITTTFGDYNSDPSVLQNVLPATLELENPLLKQIYYKGDTYTVTSIGSFNEHSMDSVTIPKTVTHIGDSAFYNTGCGYIYFQGDLEQWCEITIDYSSIALPSSYELFINGEKLVNANIPEGITSLSMNFYGCDSLTSVVLPSSLETIGSSAFQYCYALSEVYNYAPSITVSAGFTDNGYVGQYARVVYNATDLTGDKPASRIQTINNVQYYVDESEGEFIALASSIASESVTTLTLDNRTTEINQRAFLNYVELVGALDLSNCTNLSSIGQNAFANCRRLTSITIPSSVTSIESYAFSYCYALFEVYNYSEHIEVTLGNTSSSTNGYLGQYAKVVYNASDLAGEKPTSRIQTINDVQYYVYGGDFIALTPSVLRDSLITLKLDNRTTEINQCAFLGCRELTTVTLSSSLTSIGREAFSTCDSLQPSVIDQGVKYLGSSDNPYLVLWDGTGTATNNYTVNSDCKVIYNAAFEFCDSLININIPSSLLSIGVTAFYDCDGLISVDLSNCTSLTSIGSSTFSGCSNLTSISLPESLTSIGSQAFYNCGGLTSITLPSNLKEIGNIAFSGCYALVEVYNYSENIEVMDFFISGDLGRYAKVVYNASDLTGGKPASRIQTIGNVKYYVYGEDFIALTPSVARDSLTILTLDSRTTEINQWAFSECVNITSIDLSNYTNLSIIGQDAFRTCSGLTSVTLPSNLTSIGNQVFTSCSNLSEVIINSNYAYKNANGINYDDCGAILRYATIVKVLASVDDGSNSYLNNNFTKTTEGEYNVYTKN